MKKFLYAAICGFALTSCGGESAETTQTTDSTAVDTTALVNANITIDVNALLGKYDAPLALPFIQDSAYLEELEMTDSSSLTGDEVRFLSYNFVDSDLSYSAKSSIDDVLFFDSLRLNDAYDGYVEVLDIGMMKDAYAYVTENIKLDDSTNLLLWAIDFTTYEACPFFAGTTLYASVFRNNQVQSCTLIGETSGGGDAPYWSETYIRCSIEHGKISATKIDRNGGDTDEEGNDLVTESTSAFTFEIVNGSWVVTEETAAQ